ncbi:MAG: type IV pilin protein [Myxococcota bacterium]
MRISPRSRRGFTIIELMISVAIVGVLAAVAIPLLQSYQLRSKTAEAKTNLAAIRVLENAHFSEKDAYVDVDPEPAVIPGSIAAVFNGGGNFGALGFRPEGNIYFSYGVAVSADGVGFTADAGADIDADGFVQFWAFAKPDAGGLLKQGKVGCDAAGLVPEQIVPCAPDHGSSVF